MHLCLCVLYYICATYSKNENIHLNMKKFGCYFMKRCPKDSSICQPVSYPGCKIVNYYKFLWLKETTKMFCTDRL